MIGRALAATMLWLGLAGCAGGPHFGVTITNAPAPMDCFPGSQTRPCR